MANENSVFLCTLTDQHFVFIHSNGDVEITQVKRRINSKNAVVCRVSIGTEPFQINELVLQTNK